MSPKRAFAAAAAPLPYTVWALRRRQETICSVLRRHRGLFLVGVAWFVVHVIRGSASRAGGPSGA